MKELESSPHTHNLCADWDKKKCQKLGMAGLTNSKSKNNQEVKDEYNGKGTGSDVNSQNEPTSADDVPDKLERTPESTLAHELQHAYDSDKGIKSKTGRVDSSGIPELNSVEHESRAVRTEDIARAAQGLTERTKYGASNIINPGSSHSPINHLIK